MRIVTLEEHFVNPELQARFGLKADHLDRMRPEIKQRLHDLEEKRLRSMDETGISIQVISAAAPGADALEGAQGIEFAKAMNDTLKAAVNRHPARFAGFAHLPMRTPEAAADELERAVEDLDFLGALINGTTEGLFLDDPKFAPILARAEKLDVPIYIHPAMPPEAVRKVYYDRLPEGAGQMLSMAGFGWHIETAIHVLRMALAGTFERHPKLKVIIGHMGETLPFMLERSETVFKNVGRPVKETLLKHVWLTTSGFFTQPPFLNALQTWGADRILFSVDYPFANNEQGRKFLDEIPVSPEDRLKIAHRNADQLLKIPGSDFARA